MRNEELGIRNATKPAGTRDACPTRLLIGFVGQPSRLPGGRFGGEVNDIRNDCLDGALHT